jgi:hypothetical protein
MMEGNAAISVHQQSKMRALGGLCRKVLRHI